MEKWRRQYRHPNLYRQEPRRTKPLVQFSWRLSRGLMLTLGGLLVIGSLVWVVRFSSVFMITTVKAEGDVTEQLAIILETAKGDNLLFLNEADLRAELEKADPSLATAKVIRGLPNQLKVSIQRRHPTLMWESNQVRWAIDDGGVAFPLDATLATDGVLVIVDTRNQSVEQGRQLVSGEFVSFAHEAFESLPERMGGKIVRAEVGETTFHLRLVTEWNWAVILDTTRPLRGQIENVSLVLQDHRPAIHEYLDMRLAGWAYIK